METLKPWMHVVTPHADIRQGRLDESVFAADLSDVVADRGPLEYRDAALFFRKTYPTEGLVGLLSAVLGRLAGKGIGEGVIQIQTPFGGGKTHSLIALYHLVAHGRMLGAELGEILARAGVESVPEARALTFVGTAADALRGKTPWGELAAQLGRYELLAEHDEKRRAPGKDLLHALLGAQPTLILMDELAEYAVKAKDFRDQLVAFFQELTETVKVLDRCVLVVTLPASAPYGEDGERALHELQQVFKRVETIKTPVEGDEVYEVIRRRLFEEMGDPQEIRRTAGRFWEMYGRLGEDVPKEVREPAYRDRLAKAYPFHPELIDVLLTRWSTFPNFQRTRGVLRLLAQVVGGLYQARHPAPLILPAHLDLTHPAIRGELLRHIGSEYQGVIAADIAANGSAKAERIDQEMGSEYQRFGVAAGLARTIFFASFSGGEKRGVGIQRLRLGVLQPDLPPSVVGDTIKRLEDELWYLHVEGGLYQFSSRPNLNRVIVEREEAVKPEEITEEIRNRLQALVGHERKVRAILWPRASEDVPDTRELKLVILPFEIPTETTAGSGQSAEEGFAAALLGSCGQTFRVYRNTLLLLAADRSELEGVRQQVKRYLAYRAIRDDKALMRQLAEDNKGMLERRIKEAEGGIAGRLLGAYRYLIKAEGQGMRRLDLGLPTFGTKASLERRVFDYLRPEGLFIDDKLSPQVVLDKAIGKDAAEKSVDEIYDAFLKYPNLPILGSKEVLLDAIKKGVQEGLFGVKVGGQTYVGQEIVSSKLDAEARVVREPKAGFDVSPPKQPGTETGLTQVIGPDRPDPHRGGERTQTGLGQGGSGAAGATKTYRLKANVPWDKLSDFVRGVVTPLRHDGAELRVEITLEAHSDGGIKQTTLDQRVRETLRQIGAQFEEGG